MSECESEGWYHEWVCAGSTDNKKTKKLMTLVNSVNSYNTETASFE